ncbi:hypothetical protein [Microbulbifer pacificus]|uniref:hypothetical protein n=1 Tax=Microbulbifer pacificus TaxID=407164 RepID=UPI000CF5315D|nr:hypothetical protein [Microbulbifer pacificus]
MKKLVLPALVIAAIGGYFYYTNLDVPAQAVTAEEVMVEDVKAAMAEAKASGADIKPAGEDVLAAADGDVFADVPEAMDHVLDESSESVEGGMETMADTAEDVDHAHE